MTRQVVSLDPSVSTDMVSSSIGRVVGLVIDNPTAQYLHLTGLSRWVAPGVLGQQISLPGVTSIPYVWEAPPGFVQPANRSGQVATLTLSDMTVNDSPGIMVPASTGHFQQLLTTISISTTVHVPLPPGVQALALTVPVGGTGPQVLVTGDSTGIVYHPNDVVAPGTAVRFGVFDGVDATVSIRTFGGSQPVDVIGLFYPVDVLIDSQPISVISEPGGSGGFASIETTPLANGATFTILPARGIGQKGYNLRKMTLGVISDDTVPSGFDMSSGLLALGAYAGGPASAGPGISYVDFEGTATPSNTAVILTAVVTNGGAVVFGNGFLTYDFQ